MYKDDYISAFAKLAPSEAWKAETLEKMRALEKQQREQRQLEQRQKEGRAGFGSTHTSASAGVPDSAPASAFAAAPVSASDSASDSASVSASAAAGRARAKKPAPLAVHLRRAALPIAAVAMLAILPMTTLRGCGASGGNTSMALQAEDRAADGCAPAAAEPRDTAGGAENGTAAGTPAAAPSGEDDLYDGVTEETQLEAESAQSMAPGPVPEPSPGAEWAGNIGDAGDANKDTLERQKFEITYGGRPFQKLEAAEVTFASVCLTPPDATLEIPDIEELTGLLQKAVVYNRDDSYTDYDGLGVTFALTFADGTQTQITAYNPFLIIDGVGYRTEYAPCEALNQYAIRLWESGEAVTVLAQPPAMAVIGTLDETYRDALTGGYSWQSKNADGTFTDTEADGAHPLDCKAQLSPALEMTYDHTLNLLFPEGAAPDEIVRVRCWSDADWGNTAARSETVRVLGSAAGDGYAVTLKPGGCIYEVTARWDTADGYGGTASYAFYVKGIA